MPKVDWSNAIKRMNELDKKLGNDFPTATPDDFKGANIDRFMMRYLEHNIRQTYKKCDYCGQYGEPHLPCGFCGAPREESK